MMRPYPGFSDPEDWRESVSSDAPERIVRQVRQLVADAAADHVAKHDHHDHPWCARCFHRTEREAGVEPPPTYTEAYETLRERTQESLSEEDRQRLRKYLESGWDLKPGDGAEFGVTDGALEAWRDYLHACDRWDDHHRAGTTATTLRAARYLTIHGRPPLDTYDGSEPATFDDEYLWRDQLDDLPTPEPLIAGILPRHSYGILRGRDGTYKSFVALDWALCLATGKPWQGRQAEAVDVLYIAGEGAYGIAQRVAAWEQAWGRSIDPEAFQVRKSALNLHKPGAAYDDLLERVERGRFGLVVIDTLRRVAGSADGNGSDMGLIVDNLDRIKQATADGTVLAIAHTDKGDNDTRGYSGIEDDADFVWHAKRDEDQLTLKLEKMKDGPDGTTIHLAARSLAGSLVLEESAGSAISTTQNQLKILDTMRASFPDGAYSGQLLAACGMADSSYYRALAQLQAGGHLINVGSGKRPFYQLPADSHAPDGPISAGNSHNSHALPTGPVTLPPLPPPLRAGVGVTTADELERRHVRTTGTEEMTA